MTYGIPSIVAEIRLGNIGYQMPIGFEIQKMVLKNGQTISGVLSGIKLGVKEHLNTGKAIDAVPFNHFPESDPGCLVDASVYHEIEAILVIGEDQTPYTVPVSRIASIEGEFVNADGTTTKSVDLTAEEVDVVAIIAEMTDGDTLVLSEGEIAAELNITAGVTLAGANVSVAQNFYQEV